MRQAAPSLRAATPTDLAAILELIRGLAEYEHLAHAVVAQTEDLRAALFGPRPAAHAMLAEADGQAVGLALFYYTFSTFRGRANLFLEDLFVRPQWRGRGIGAALLGALAARAVAEGCARVEWRVLDTNAPAIAFYEKLGAVPMRDWHVRQLEGAALRALAEGADHG
ncbi:MAG: GNAT family N-acetyltransferase [Rhodospirillales bacterium]|nr:GNAT family N-acetyltransferase [Rhodospirillales bacterium]